MVKKRTNPFSCMLENVYFFLESGKDRGMSDIFKYIKKPERSISGFH